jgi:prepilin-type N-terminal cleavage/methylation domain-containing protein
MSRSGPSHRLPRTRGFTLVELVVAVLIMAVGVMGLASTAAVVSRLMGGAGQQVVAAAVASSRFEQLRSLQCSRIAGGAATTRGVSEKWSIGGTTPNLAVVDSVTSVKISRRRATTQVYSSFVRCTP